ncbi:MAG: hypothetical protein RLZ75_2386, partial [Pseudomonadota bacterium]
GTVVQHLNPLDSPRPTIPPDKVSSRYANIEDVNARLWQDPFSVISKHDPESKEEAQIRSPSASLTKDAPSENSLISKHSIAAFIGSINDIGSKNITVLGVMVSGSDYAENIEARRRTRYAVLSGLAVKNYVPKDQEHIGYVEKVEDIYEYLRKKAPNKEENNTVHETNMERMPKKIPFEWFKSDKNDNRPPILVLWLDDTVFASQSNPLYTTSEFVRLMNEATKSTLTFKFIGPASSNTLQVMLDELDANQPLKKLRQFIEEVKGIHLNDNSNPIETVKVLSKTTKINTKQQKKRCKPLILICQNQNSTRILNTFAVSTDSEPLNPKVDDLRKIYQLRNLRFYNAVATGDYPGLYIPATQNKDDDKYKKIIQTYIQSLGLDSLFTRTSLTDYQLAEALLKELQLRGFKYDESFTVSPLMPNITGIKFDKITNVPFKDTRQIEGNWLFPFISCVRNNDFSCNYDSSVSTFKLTGFNPQTISFYPYYIEPFLFDFYYPSKNKDHIVLISEWDTIYGRRGLPRAMKEQLVPMKSYCDSEKIRNNQCQWPDDIDWIHTFSYMRGLDGITPSTEKKSEGSKVNDKDKEKNNTDIDLERPEGENQQDYLRRLAIHIAELKQELEKKGESIKAIGILGSDAYDTLMILKAVRPYFPQAMFFTTDLDTRLMHPKEFDITRNLIVASSFDLQLADKLQQSIPPFRDSYQTANFFATQIALEDANNPENPLRQEDINTMLGTARVFETANNKAVALHYHNAQGDECQTLADCKNAHPPIPEKNKSRDIWILVLLWFLFWLVPCSYFLHKYWGEGEGDEGKKIALKIIPWNKYALTALPWVVVIELIALLPLLVMGFYYVWGDTSSLFGESGEPFFWNAGISIWPTELIRLFAGLLACLFIANAITAVKQNNKQLKKRFHLNNTVTTVGVAALWKKYYVGKRVRYTVIGIIAASIIFLCFGLWAIMPPFVPYRGDPSFIANCIALGFSVVPFVFLIMAVCGITIHSTLFIKELDKLPSVWPKEKLRELGLINISNSHLQLFLIKLVSEKKYHLNEWLDIKFIATYSKVVGNLLYYPFIILALMILARSKVFDNWDLPTGLLIVLSIAVILTLGSAFYLRYVAEQARKKVIKEITKMKIFLASQVKDNGHEEMQEQIDLILADIKEIHEGAFQSLTSDPAFQALLIPFGGYGGVMLLENLLLGM